MSITSRLTLALLCAVCGFTLLLAQWRSLPSPLVTPAGYACLAILPGLALVAWLGRDLRGIGSQATAIALGPVISGCVLSLLMLSGLSVSVAALTAGLLFAIAAAVGVARKGRDDTGETGAASKGGGRAAWLIAVAAMALVAVFPLMGEGWRLRSDAWFHVAVVYEIRDFGLPPTDPFFSGLPLQYMWMYHVYTAALAQAASIHPSWAMAAVNIQAIACLVLATFAVSRSLGGGPSGSALSSFFVLVGINGLFWVFLPFRLARTLVGDVRGWDELARQLSLCSLNMMKMRTFVSVWKSQPFLLDKFIVATAFSLAVCLSMAFALLAFRYISGGRRSAGVLAACSMAGIALYHTPTAVAFGGAAGLALVAVALTSTQPYRRRALLLVMWMALAGGLTAPYLYNVSSGKESAYLVPLGLSVTKLGCILISCATAFLFAGPTLVRFLRSRGSPQYFYGLFAAGAIVVSLVLVLPGPNTFDKTPYFAFLFLAPVAGWGIEAVIRKGATPLRRTLRALACVAAVVPSSALVYPAYLASPGRPPATPAEQKLYSWVPGHTPRDAVFLDSNDRVGIAVMGPRRLIWGRESYADQWGYNRDEMARRRGLRDRVYSGEQISGTDAERLSRYGQQVYVILRSEDSRDGAAAPGPAGSPYFTLEYTGDGIDVYRVVSGRPHDKDTPNARPTE